MRDLVASGDPRAEAEERASSGLMRRLALWKVFAITCCVSLAASYAWNRWFLQGDAYRALLLTRISREKADALLASTQRDLTWGALLSPAVFAGRALIVASALQFPFVIGRFSVPFARFFRAALWGTIAQAAEYAALMLLPARVVNATEQAATGIPIPPLSLAAVAARYDLSISLKMLLGNANAFELGWILLVIVALGRPPNVRRRFVIATVLGVWALFYVAQSLAVLLATELLA